MNITINVEGTKMTALVEGRVDTTTAPELEARLKEQIEGIKTLELDFKNLDYISSAGLRVLLLMQKMINDHGSMVIYNANDNIRDIFDVTGFCDILTIK